jgi:hypothetical protein
MNWTIVRTSALCFLMLAGCKSAHDRGKDLADDKLGFAEGVADGVKDKGGTVGKKGVEGIGEVVKGIGSAVKDQTMPAVTINVPNEADGVTVRDAFAKLATSQRTVDATFTFSKKFEGGMQLVAMDERGKEGPRSATIPHETRLAGTEAALKFAFPNEAHLSGYKTYQLVVVAAKTATPAADLLGATATQLRETPPMVSLYMTFPKKLGFALQLRAYDASGQEVGRSSPSEVVAPTDDSAGIIKFTFPNETPFGGVAKYEIRSTRPTLSNVKGASTAQK